MIKPEEMGKIISEVMEKRKEQKLGDRKIPTPEELREKVVMDMILFNSRHGRFNSAKD